VYHLELRKFPHNECRFNLDEDELDEIVRPWVRGEWIRVGERNWNVHAARLTILEGPQLAPGELTMGRGWRIAERHGNDVTRQVLERAHAALGATAGAGGGGTAPGLRSAGGRPDDGATGESPGGDAEALRGELLALLGEAPEPLLSAWRRAVESMPQRTPSESRAAAEAELASLRPQEVPPSSG
jgi:hypothetical protein